MTDQERINRLEQQVEALRESLTEALSIAWDLGANYDRVVRAIRLIEEADEPAQRPTNEGGKP